MARMGEGAERRIHFRSFRASAVLEIIHWTSVIAQSGSGKSSSAQESVLRCGIAVHRTGAGLLLS